MKSGPCFKMSGSALRAAQNANLGVYLSPFTAGEIGTLVAKGRHFPALQPLARAKRRLTSCQLTTFHQAARYSGRRFWYLR